MSIYDVIDIDENCAWSGVLRPQTDRRRRRYPRTAPTWRPRLWRGPGAVDLQFSSSANLDLFQLDFTSDDRQMPSVASAPTFEKFSRFSWCKGAVADSLGLIAGGLVDGNIALWNPNTLIRSVFCRRRSPHF